MRFSIRDQVAISRLAAAEYRRRNKRKNGANVRVNKQLTKIIESSFGSHVITVDVARA